MPKTDITRSTQKSPYHFCVVVVIDSEWQGLETNRAPPALLRKKLIVFVGGNTIQILTKICTYAFCILPVPLTLILAMMFLVLTHVFATPLSCAVFVFVGHDQSLINPPVG